MTNKHIVIGLLLAMVAGLCCLPDMIADEEEKPAVLDSSIPKTAKPADALAAFINTMQNNDGKAAADLLAENSYKTLATTLGSTWRASSEEPDAHTRYLAEDFREFLTAKQLRADFIEFVSKKGKALLGEDANVKISEEKVIAAKAVRFKLNASLHELKEVVVVWEDNAWKVDLFGSSEGYPSPKKLSNERTVPATLKSIHSQETIFKEKKYLDEDEDEVGEYAPLIDATFTVDPSNINDLLDAGLSMYSDAAGNVEKNGYLYALFLPATGTDDVEEAFCVSAWPKKWDKTGNMAFFLNESGITNKAANAAGALGDGYADPVALNEIYGTDFDNTTIIVATWSVVK